MPFPNEPLNYKDTNVADYAGDGVYVINFGYAIELRANDHENPTDRIMLEPNVVEALFRILKRWDKLPRGYGKGATL